MKLPATNWPIPLPSLGVFDAQRLTVDVTAPGDEEVDGVGSLAKQPIVSEWEMKDQIGDESTAPELGLEESMKNYIAGVPMERNA